jgi:hypothetical protein
LGDGVLDRDSYARWCTSTSTSSSTRNSHAADTAAVEEKRETVKQDGAESNADERAHLRDTAHKSLAYVQFV